MHSDARVNVTTMHRCPIVVATPSAVYQPPPPYSRASVSVSRKRSLHLSLLFFYIPSMTKYPINIKLSYYYYYFFFYTRFSSSTSSGFRAPACSSSRTKQDAPWRRLETYFRVCTDVPPYIRSFFFLLVGNFFYSVIFLKLGENAGEESGIYIGGGNVRCLGGENVVVSSFLSYVCVYGD